MSVLTTLVTTGSRKRPNKPVRMACLAAGSFVGAMLFAIVGSITGRAAWGAISGALIGAVVGWGWCSKLISPAVAWMCCFAIAGAILGPGCDADALSSALFSGAIGAFIGYLRWPGRITLVGAFVALCMGPFAFSLFIIGLCVYFFAIVLDWMGILPPDPYEDPSDPQRARSKSRNQ